MGFLSRMVSGRGSASTESLEDEVWKRLEHSREAPVLERVGWAWSTYSIGPWGQPVKPDGAIVGQTFLSEQALMFLPHPQERLLFDADAFEWPLGPSQPLMLLTPASTDIEDLRKVELAKEIRVVPHLVRLDFAPPGAKAIEMLQADRFIRLLRHSNGVRLLFSWDDLADGEDDDA